MIHPHCHLVSNRSATADSLTALAPFRTCYIISYCCRPTHARCAELQGTPEQATDTATDPLYTKAHQLASNFLPLAGGDQLGGIIAEQQLTCSTLDKALARRNCGLQLNKGLCEGTIGRTSVLRVRLVGASLDSRGYEAYHSLWCWNSIFCRPISNTQ